MTLRRSMHRLLDQESINFVLTNRIPRRSLTRLAGRLSRIEQPHLRDISIRLWRFFSDLDLSEAETGEFRSLHDCFTRRLKPGARPIDADPRTLVSPCDAVIGAFGKISGTDLYQIKGRRYALADLLGDAGLVDLHRDGSFATLRLKSSMYHRFHAPHDCRVDRVSYIAGDTFNVNPPALKRVDRLFCRNERAILHTNLAGSGHVVTIVPVAAILVAGIRLNFLDVENCLRKNAFDSGRSTLPCNTEFRKGAEMGWFEHGSTIIVFAPDGFSFAGNVKEGAPIRVGEPLLRLPETGLKPRRG